MSHALVNGLTSNLLAILVPGDVWGGSAPHRAREAHILVLYHTGGIGDARKYLWYLYKHKDVMLAGL